MAHLINNKPRLIGRRALLHAPLAVAFLIPKLAGAQTGEQVGSVQEVKGEAFADARDRRRSLEPTAPLFLNELIGTGPDARLVLRLGSDTTLRMGASARLTIDNYLVKAGGDITLQSGPILFDRPAGAAPEPVQIHSSFGLIAVRGTRFFAGPSAGVMGIFVMDGSVTVSAAGTEVVVQTGQGTNIAQPGAAPTPPAPWGDPRTRAAMDSVM
jgi:ferric-dicitrate binding protein FerR (iron transport regulator)